MDPNTSIESCKWQGWRPSVIYKGKEAVTVSPQEADYICQHRPEYQWDMRKNLPQGIRLVTIYDVSSGSVATQGF